VCKKYKDKTYESFHIVEAYRDKGKVKTPLYYQYYKITNFIKTTKRENPEAFEKFRCKNN